MLSAPVILQPFPSQSAGHRNFAAVSNLAEHAATNSHSPDDTRPALAGRRHHYVQRTRRIGRAPSGQAKRLGSGGFGYVAGRLLIDFDSGPAHLHAGIAE